MGHFLALNFSCWLCCFSGGYAARRDPQVAPFCGGARTWYRRQPDNRQPPSSNPPPALSIPLFQLGTTLTGYFHIEMWQPRTIYFLESNIARLLCKVIFKIPLFPISSKNSRYPRKSRYFTTIYINAKNFMGLPQLGDQTPIMLKKKNNAWENPPLWQQNVIGVYIWICVWTSWIKTTGSRSFHYR